MTTTPFVAEPATSTPIVHNEVQVSARALRLLLLDAQVAMEPTADELPMLHAVHLHTTEHPQTGATTLISTGTDRFLAVQANASARGWLAATAIEAPFVHQMVTVLTDYIAIEEPPDQADDVRLVRRNKTVRLYMDAIDELALPISRYEFPMTSLIKEIEQPPQPNCCTQTPALVPVRQSQRLATLAAQRGQDVQMITPGDGTVAHIRIGENVQAWLKLPAPSDTAATPTR